MEEKGEFGERKREILQKNEKKIKIGLTKWGGRRILCGTPTRGTSKGELERASRPRKQVARDGSQEASSGTARCGTGKVRKDEKIHRGEAREERRGEEEVVMRVVAGCEDKLLRELGAEVMAQAGERSPAWSSNFKSYEKDIMESLILAQNERWRRG